MRTARTPTVAAERPVILFACRPGLLPGPTAPWLAGLKTRSYDYPDRTFSEPDSNRYITNCSRSTPVQNRVFSGIGLRSGS